MYTSTAPAQDQWTAATIDASTPLVVVSCWSLGGSQCVAIDATGYVFWSQNPAGGAGTWVRSRHPIDVDAEITGLSCGDEGWCVAVDNRGTVLTQYQTPIGGWYTTSYVSDSSSSLIAVSCTPTFCLAANGYGSVFTNKTTQGGKAWPALNGSGGVKADDGVSSVSCLPGGLCVLTSPRETATDEALNPFGWGVGLVGSLELRSGHLSPAGSRLLRRRHAVRRDQPLLPGRRHRNRVHLTAVAGVVHRSCGGRSGDRRARLRPAGRHLLRV